MMNDKQIKHMVERFLSWRLPENFNPDGGISFKKTINENQPSWPQKNEPVGTNLLDFTQATEMVRYMVEGLPAAPAVPESATPARLSEEQVIRLAECAWHILCAAGCYVLSVETIYEKFNRALLAPPAESAAPTARAVLRCTCLPGTPHADCTFHGLATAPPAGSATPARLSMDEAMQIAGELMSQNMLDVTCVQAAFVIRRALKDKQPAAEGGEG